VTDQPVPPARPSLEPEPEEKPARVAVRAPAGSRYSRPRSVPDPDDLYQRDQYGETLLRSLIRAQVGVTIGVLLPAAAVVATYPLLSVLVPGVTRAMVGPLPLSVLVLGFGLYPPLVLLALAYVRLARRVEERFVKLLHEE
jgi:hypothetical protein